MPSSLNGTGVTFNDNSTLQSGNIPAANLGSGTANVGTVLRGDRTWGAPPAPTTAQVLSATAGASVGAVGTYAFLGFNSGTSALSIGSTTAGSNLRYVTVGSSSSWNVNFTDNLTGHGGGGTPAGTWRAMGGSSNANRNKATIWLRIS
jgi:hypothetical protein